MLAGGIWYYTDHIRPNQGAAGYKELVANDGKELMAFSDFPMPEENDMVLFTYSFFQLVNIKQLLHHHSNFHSCFKTTKN